MYLIGHPTKAARENYAWGAVALGMSPGRNPKPVPIAGNDLMLLIDSCKINRLYRGISASRRITENSIPHQIGKIRSRYRVAGFAPGPAMLLRRNIHCTIAATVHAAFHPGSKNPEKQINTNRYGVVTRWHAHCSMTGCQNAGKPALLNTDKGGKP